MAVSGCTGVVNHNGPSNDAGKMHAANVHERGQLASMLLEAGMRENTVICMEQATNEDGLFDGVTTVGFVENSLSALMEVVKQSGGHVERYGNACLFTTRGALRLRNNPLNRPIPQGRLPRRWAALYPWLSLISQRDGVPCIALGVIQPEILDESDDAVKEPCKNVREFMVRFAHKKHRKWNITLRAASDGGGRVTGMDFFP